MKKFLILLFVLIVQNAFAEPLTGGIIKNVVDEKFFGNWVVQGKIIGNAPKEFKKSTSQIWNLWKVENVIILENKLSGARGEVKIDKAFSSSDGAYLKFTNIDKKDLGNGVEIILVETPEITLKNNSFQGVDTFEVKKYKDNALYSQKVVKYQITGRKLENFS